MRTTHHDRHRCAQNADHLTHNRPFSAFFAEVVCTLGTIPPQTVISPSPNGGNGVIRDPTRRRHAASQFLMLQNPHRRREGTRATGVPPDARPDCGTCGRRARLRHLWAAAGPGRASRRRTEPHVSTPSAAGAEGSGGMEGQAAVPVGGGGAWPGFEPTHKHTSVHQAPPVRRAPEGSAAVPVGGGGAWPGFEATRRAKLAARTARGRAAAHRHTQRPGPTAPGTPAVPQRNEAATGCPATASSRSRSTVHNSATSDQAVMSTWSSTAARPASRRATGTRNGEQDT